MLLRKRPAAVEVYNDLDSEVVNFFRILRSRTDELIRAVALTPYAREEQQGAYDIECDELERARRFFVLSWQSRGANRGSWRTGWRYIRSSIINGHTPIQDWHLVDRIAECAARWKNVYVEQDLALKVIARYDTPATLFYCDPPYVHSSRSIRWSEKAYRHEMTDEDHRALAATLHEAKGMVVLSGYHTPLYDELYGDWRTVETSVSTDGRGRPGKAVEVLWLSPKAAVAVQQQPMFEDGVA